MACTKEDLQQRIRSTAVMSDGKTRFSEELRRDVIEYAKERLAEGESRNSIAVELGMNAWTLSRWHQKPRRAKTSAGATSFIEVSQKVGQVSGAPGQCFEVVCPSGFEVRVPARFELASFLQLISALEGR